MNWRPSEVDLSPRKLAFFGHFQPAFACPVVFLAEISSFQGSLVRQMLLLAKEMKEKVKNEIVLHPPNSDARWGRRLTQTHLFLFLYQVFFACQNHPEVLKHVLQKWESDI